MKGAMNRFTGTTRRAYLLIRAMNFERDNLAGAAAGTWSANGGRRALTLAFRYLLCFEKKKKIKNATFVLFRYYLYRSNPRVRM